MNPQQVGFSVTYDTRTWQQALVEVDGEPQVILITDRLRCEAEGRLWYEQFMNGYHEVTRDPSCRAIMYARWPAYPILKARLAAVNVLIWFVRRLDVH